MKWFWVRLAAALVIAAVLVRLIDWDRNERLYTQGELLSLLAETYGEEFTVVDCRKVSREYVGGTYAHEGNVYTLSPANDPELAFEVWDFIRVTDYNLGGPPASRYHSLGVFYVDEALARDVGELCREQGIRDRDGEGRNLDLSPENWEEQLAALAAFFEGCNSRGPYNRGSPYVVSFLRLRVDSGQGTVARCDPSFRNRDGVYGLNEEVIREELTKRLERNRAITAIAFPLWEFLGEVGVERELTYPQGKDLSYEDQRDPVADMTVYVETEEELDDFLAKLEEFAVDLPENEVFSTPGALGLEEEVELKIQIKQFSQTWYPFAPYVGERLGFKAADYKDGFEASMFWQREITGQEPDRVGEQETVSIGGQQEQVELGSVSLEEDAE